MGDVKTFRMYIGGEWTEASDGNTRQIVSPANGDVIAEVPEGTSEDVDRAVRAAKRIVVSYAGTMNAGIEWNGRPPMLSG